MRSVNPAMWSSSRMLCSEHQGTSEAVNAKYELMERGGYIPTGYTFDPVVLNARLPLEFFEARNALRIAQSEGAEQYATASYEHAVQLMNNADEYATRKHLESKPLIAVSRDAVQTAEDAREIAIKKLVEIRLANERQASSDAQVQAQAQTDTAMRKRPSPVGRGESASGQHAGPIGRRPGPRRCCQCTVHNRASSSGSGQQPGRVSHRALAAQADAEQSRLAAQTAQASAQAAETDKAAMRTKLSEQLNAILQTRDSARGLIVSMSDVLFDTGKYSLKSGAREKLAKVADIYSLTPDSTLKSAAIPTTWAAMP